MYVDTSIAASGALGMASVPLCLCVPASYIGKGIWFQSLQSKKVGNSSSHHMMMAMRGVRHSTPRLLVGWGENSRLCVRQRESRTSIDPFYRFAVPLARSSLFSVVQERGERGDGEAAAAVARFSK